MVLLDLYDKKILFELDINSRISASKIAKKIKLPKETINYRIKKLIDNGIIEYFYTIINAASLGYDYKKIFLRIDKMSIEKENQIITFLSNKKNCSNIRLLQGQYEITFLVMYKNIFELKEFFEKLLKSFGDVIIEKNIHLITESYKLNQKILFEGDKFQKYFKHINENHKIDITDINIIKNLMQNARIKTKELAKLIGIHPVKVAYRRKKLEQLGIIVGYSTKLNLTKLDYEKVQIDFSLTNIQVAKSIIEFFDTNKLCLFAYEMIGDFDLSIEIAIKNDEELRIIMDKFKQKYFNDYRTYTVSHIYKECVSNWSPFYSGKTC